jgi:hypothetical protein
MPDGNSESTYTYWAALPAQELVDVLQDKERRYFSAAERRGLKSMWSIAWAQYYGTDPSNPTDLATQTTARVGPEAEFTRFRINEVRSFIKQQNVIALGDRPAFQCLVLNSDHDALASVEIADSIVEYLYKKALGEAKEREVLEAEGVFGAAYGHLRWDFEGGDDVKTMQPVTGADGQPVMGPDGQPAQMPQTTKSGAPFVDVCAPWDVALDPSVRADAWSIVRERASKWEIAATYPDQSEEILSTAGLDEYCIERLFGHDFRPDDEDDCIVKHFYHPRCRAMPNGRYLGYCGTSVLWDDACPVPEGTPLIDLCAGRFIGSAFGYADSWDLISIQEMIDQLCSDTASNLSTFGRNTIVYDKGSELDASMIAMGLRALAKTPGSDPPTALNYASMPESVKWFIEYLHARHQSISGLNSVARGNPSDNIKSGQMAALFHSIAIEFQSARQAALDGFRERMANMMLDMVRSFSTAPFLVEVAGVSERPYLREFTKQSVSGVRKVRVETANPMLRSQAGRFEMFQALKDVEPEKRDAVLRGLTTGDWSGYSDDSRSRDLRVVWENEQLSNGNTQEVQVGAGDNPFKHVMEHWALLEKLSAQDNADGNLVGGVLQHIMSHIEAWQNIDPRLATLLNIPLPPPIPGSPTWQMQMSMMMGAPPPPAAGAGAGGPSAPPPPGGPPSGNAPAGRDPSGVKLPTDASPPPGANLQNQPPRAA